MRMTIKEEKKYQELQQVLLLHTVGRVAVDVGELFVIDLAEEVALMVQLGEHVH